MIRSPAPLMIRALSFWRVGPTRHGAPAHRARRRARSRRSTSATSTFAIATAVARTIARLYGRRPCSTARPSRTSTARSRRATRRWRRTASLRESSPRRAPSAARDLLHISTDYVFDGSASTPYRPDAPTAPLNVYGASKLEGERRVSATDRGAVVVRTAWLHSGVGANFVKTAVRVLGSGTPDARRRRSDRHADARASPGAGAVESGSTSPASRERCTSPTRAWRRGSTSPWPSWKRCASAKRLPDGAAVEPIASSERPAIARRPVVLRARQARLLARDRLRAAALARGRRRVHPRATECVAFSSPAAPDSSVATSSTTGCASIRMIASSCSTRSRTPATWRRSPASSPTGRLTFVHGDIVDADLVARVLAEHDIDTIVHFAAESHVDRSIVEPGSVRADERRRHAGVARRGTAGVARVGFVGAQGVRFHHVSTDEVYGSLAPNDPPFTEQTPYSPNSPYAASKAASDHLVRAYHHTYGLPVTISNCSNNYGPYQFPEKLIPLMIVNALIAKPLPVYGDGKQVRDWLFVEDHCVAIDRILRADVTGRTFNVGGRAEHENVHIVDQLCDADRRAVRDRRDAFETGFRSVPRARNAELRGVDHPRAGSTGPRSPLRHRSDAHRVDARLRAPARRCRTGLGSNRGLVSRTTRSGGGR